MLAECPRPLGGEVMASRIYSPFSYPLPRRARIVPVVSIEAERLVATFPLVWRRGVSGPELCVLRTLMEDGTGFVAGSDRALALLPLIFQAYPLLLPSDTALAPSGNPRLLDVAVADAPTDAGAPLAGPDGRPTRATELRLKALEIFERDFTRTLALGVALETHGLLEPWPLGFDLGLGRRCDIDDLLVVPTSAFDGPRLAPVLAEFGIAAAKLLAMHRLSLFRAGPLVGAARAAVAATVAPPAAAARR
ncbi:SapC family protein [Aureimonas leprariae]|uniref:SapC family protein n=1 Tax=Plantimonas leprariae TaxID=2615207 RepID=A0A7V7TZ90_9HYPH|nr:SapC family protein [Aureimonas leprariae]KAB0679034.1 SapC family protein [Aureimonas leprariae]